VQPHAFHRHHRAAANHLRTIRGGGGERFIVRLERPDSVVLNDLADVPEAIKKSRHGRTGIAGHQVDTTFDFQTSLNQQLVAGENFVAT
jgi:hypothetical protein